MTNAQMIDEVKPPYVEMTPSMLVSQVISGDGQAEQEMANRYWRSLVFILNRRAQNLQLAQDIAQDTFITVIQNLRQGKLNDPDALAAYIRNTGQFQLIAHFRKETRRDTHSFADHGLDIPDQMPDKSPSLLQQVNGEMALGLVKQVIGELAADRDRQLLILFYLNEQDKKAICQKLSLTPAQFDRVLYRARNRLKTLVEHKHGPDFYSVDTVSLLLVLCGGLLLATERHNDKKNSGWVGETSNRAHNHKTAVGQNNVLMDYVQSPQYRNNRGAAC
jgi:RNA polymerase sigma factor (sigma-70 family)